MWIADSSLNHDIHLKFDFIQWFMKYDLLTAGSQHLDELTIDLNSFNMVRPGQQLSSKYVDWSLLQMN